MKYPSLRSKHFKHIYLFKHHNNPMMKVSPSSFYSVGNEDIETLNHTGQKSGLRQ